MNNTCKIQHFITKLNLLIPKNHKWNNDLIQRWKNHEFKTNKEILNILNKLHDKSIIIEAGGHIGDTTFLMSTYLNYIGNKSLIYVFEPDITKCNYINDIININKINNIKIFNFGLSNKFSTGSLDKKLHAGAWTIKDGDDFKIIPLDSINYENPVSFIKLDVEGFEYNALVGAEKTIKKFNPILCIERENKEIKEFLTKNFKYNLYLKTDLDYFYS
jgi:FkbM family methyltransferase